MDYNENTPNQDEAPENSTPDVAVSSTRRAFTAILVLVAALLLGYVLYTVLLQTKDTSDSPGNVSELDTTAADRRAALAELRRLEAEEFGAADGNAVSQQDREANLEKIDDSDAPAADAEVSSERRKEALLKLKQ